MCCFTETVGCFILRQARQVVADPELPRQNQRHLADEVQRSRVRWAHLATLTPEARKLLAPRAALQVRGGLLALAATARFVHCSAALVLRIDPPTFSVSARSRPCVRLCKASTAVDADPFAEMRRVSAHSELTTLAGLPKARAASHDARVASRDDADVMGSRASHASRSPTQLAEEALHQRQRTGLARLPITPYLSDDAKTQRGLRQK